MPAMRLICLAPLAPLALAAGLAAGAAAAHPHVFVEARVSLVLDGQGNVLGVRLSWDYDEFFSFLLTAELGIDPEGDMILTEAEIAALSDFVLDWPADFGGDLFVTQDGAPLALGAREQARVTFDGGRVSESHYRPLLAPAAAGATGVAVQIYDPFYYVAYQVVGEIGLEGGTGCATRYQAADLNAAYAMVDELLYGRPASDVGPDEAFPEVGHAFADTVTVTCAG